MVMGRSRRKIWEDKPYGMHIYMGCESVIKVVKYLYSQLRLEGVKFTFRGPIYVHGYALYVCIHSCML